MDAPAGWYPDPRDPRLIRWWDSAAWTEHTAAAPSTAWAPPTAPALDAPWPPAAELTARRNVALPVVAGVVALVLLVGLVGAVIQGRRTSTGPQAGPSRSAQPTPGATTPAPGSSPTPEATGTPGATSTEGGAVGAVLETFEPPPGFVSPSVTTELIDGGDTTDDPTLDGWCSTAYASEKNRVARRQWRLAVDGQGTGWSIEVVAYGTTAQAEAALAEFVATTKACRNVTLTDGGGTQTQLLVSTPKVPVQRGVTGSQGRITIDFERDGGTTRANSVGLVQQSGRYLSVLWAGQPSALTSSDDAVLERLRAQQARALLDAG